MFQKMKKISVPIELGLSDSSKYTGMIRFTQFTRKA